MTPGVCQRIQLTKTTQSLYTLIIVGGFLHWGGGGGGGVHCRAGTRIPLSHIHTYL